MNQFISEKETAKIVKKELQTAFPGIKFSVRSQIYSGGSSIHVAWVDGPTYDEVEKIAGKYHSGEFDGMTDLKYYNDEPYGNDFIFFDRHFSQRFAGYLLENVDLQHGNNVTLRDLVEAAMKKLRGVNWNRLWYTVDGVKAEIDTGNANAFSWLRNIAEAFEELGYTAKYNEHNSGLLIERKNV